MTPKTLFSKFDGWEDNNSSCIKKIIALACWGIILLIFGAEMLCYMYIFG